MDDAQSLGPAAELDASPEGCRARARALIPILAAAAPRIEAGRELPGDVLDALHAAGMFRLLLPRSMGGFELKPADYVQCIEAIAMADGRLETLAADLVAHWETRKETMAGKAMIVAISREAAVRLFNEIVKLRPAWRGGRR